MTFLLGPYLLSSCGLAYEGKQIGNHVNRIEVLLDFLLASLNVYMRLLSSGTSPSKPARSQDAASPITHIGGSAGILCSP